MKLQEAKEYERYSFSWSGSFDQDTGCIGHLRGDFGSNGDEFWTTWWPHEFEKEGKTPEFQQEFDDLINSLRDKDQEVAPLSSRKAMAQFCREYPNARLGQDMDWYVFRGDSEKYTYLFRFFPLRGDYNFYVYCYVGEKVRRDMKEAGLYE